MTFTDTCLAHIDLLRQKVLDADAVVVGAGAGLSTAAGLDYAGIRFQNHFADFIAKYRFTDMYSAGFYPFASLEERWAYWSRHIFHNRYEHLESTVYTDILRFLKQKEFFVITTNADHLFLRSGFPKNRLFYTQGDYGLWQCSFPCHMATYDNEKAVSQMVDEQKDMRIPSSLIPLCPQCKRPMTMNLRCDGTFVQDAGWYAAHKRYTNFLQQYQDAHIVFLELGVGENTPSIIKYPFWGMTQKNPKAHYITINRDAAFCPPKIRKHAVCIGADIAKVTPLLCTIQESS